MTSKVKQATESLKERLLVEMANLYPEETGIHSNYVIYISTKQGTHGARVKVFKKGQAGRNKPCIVLSISKEPKVLENFNLDIKAKDLAEIKYWVSINSVNLMNLWKADSENISITLFVKQLDKVDK